MSWQRKHSVTHTHGERTAFRIVNYTICLVRNTRRVKEPWETAFHACNEACCKAGSVFSSGCQNDKGWYKKKYLIPHIRVSETRTVRRYCQPDSCRDKIGQTVVAIQLVRQLWRYCWSDSCGDTAGQTVVAILLVRQLWRYSWSDSCGDTVGQTALTILLVRQLWRYCWSDSFDDTAGQTALTIQLVRFPQGSTQGCYWYYCLLNETNFPC